jgi:hypothetical protein
VNKAIDDELFVRGGTRKLICSNNILNYIIGWMTETMMPILRSDTTMTPAEKQDPPYGVFLNTKETTMKFHKHIRWSVAHESMIQGL